MLEALTAVLAALGLTAIIAITAFQADLEVTRTCDYVKTEMRWVGKFEAMSDIYDCDRVEHTVAAGTGK